MDRTHVEIRRRFNQVSARPRRFRDTQSALLGAPLSHDRHHGESFGFRYSLQDGGIMSSEKRVSLAWQVWSVGGRHLEGLFSLCHWHAWGQMNPGIVLTFLN